MDSTGSKLREPGAWLTEDHITRRRRLWRKLQPATARDIRPVILLVMTDRNTNHVRQIDLLLKEVDGAIASFEANSVYNCNDDFAEIIVPLRSYDEHL